MYSNNLTKFVVKASRDLHNYDKTLSVMYSSNPDGPINSIRYHLYSLPVDYIQRRSIMDRIQNRRNILNNRKNIK